MHYQLIRKSVKSIIILFVLGSFALANSVVAQGVGRGNYQPKTVSATQRPTEVKLEAGLQAPTTVKRSTTRNIGENVRVIKSLSRDYATTDASLSVFDNKFTLIVPAAALSGPSDVELLQINEVMDLPWNLDLASDIYQFDWKNKTNYVAGQTLSVELQYNHQDNVVYQVYFFDNTNHTWKPLNTVDYPAVGKIKAEIKLPFARLAVLANSGVMTVGKASWYGYKGGDFAASPDFPKGSILRVTAVESGKSVDVTVNDYGPERGKHPERVVDLDKVAFAKIASLGAGVINVRVEPLRIAQDNVGKVLGVKVSGATSQPTIAAKAGYVMDQDGNEFFAKDPDEQLALASLSKIVAIKVFLDTKPNFFKQVEYKNQDEAFNLLYVKPGEAAKVRLQDGDQVSIRDLLYSALVGSANNAVESLVRLSGISRDNFIARMNSIVKEWGANNTKFVEPTGLSPKNVSSARDYAIISKAVMQGVEAEISATTKYEFTTVNTNQKHTILNTNWLVRDGNYQIVASKTGYLVEAKHCLMNVVQVGDKKYFMVTLGAQNKNDSFSDMNDLIKYVYKQQA
jgi:D-alanyl-D-alanine endopeptidase (penicillin-binding protein 7)